MQKLTQGTGYVIVGRDPSLGSTRNYRYVNFNQTSKSSNPIIVTAIGHSAENQVYFSSVEEAKKFLRKFTAQGRECYEFAIKEYKGTYSNSILMPITSKYGQCWRILRVIS